MGSRRRKVSRAVYEGQPGCPPNSQPWRLSPARTLRSFRGSSWSPERHQPRPFLCFSLLCTSLVSLHLGVSQARALSAAVCCRLLQCRSTHGHMHTPFQRPAAPVGTQACTGNCLHTDTLAHTCSYTHMDTPTHTCSFLHTRTNLQGYTHTYLYAPSRTHTHTCPHLYRHTYLLMPT